MTVSDFLVIASLSFFFYSCSTTKKTTKIESQTLAAPPKTFQSIASEKYQEPSEFKFNAEKTHVLCVAKQAQNRRPSLRFFIYDLNSNRIIWEDSQPGGKIKWLNSHQIEVQTHPGIVHGNEEKSGLTGYVYDLKLKRKIKKSSLFLEK